jgi:hypothetical protein
LGGVWQWVFDGAFGGKWDLVVSGWVSGTWVAVYSRREEWQVRIHKSSQARRRDGACVVSSRVRGLASCAG